MAKAIMTQVKLQIPGGSANPAPPVGTVLGPQGIAIQDFCQQFNDKTKDQRGEILPVVVTIYDDRSFDFIIKTPPAAELLKKAAGIKKGSGSPLAQKIGSVTKAQIREIAELKMVDLNTDDVDAAMNTIEGTARQMGLEVKE
jgi:large subunit ribosomal protein L11